MKVVYHQVMPVAEESFRVLEVRGTNHPCTWHFHPECQLGLLLSGSGHRIAGFLPRLPDQSGERLQRICSLIQERLAEPLQRDTVAAAAHFSPAAFSRFFKARTGKTFHAFVNELRVGRACRLLAEREMNVTEIAFACGFSNVASFNRTFRREKRKSPTEFRRALPALN